MKAVFLDRDGTVTVGTPTIERIDSVDKAKLLPNMIEALSELSKLDYAVFFVTNQASLAEGRITLEEFYVINDYILELIAPSGIKITKTYFCPHGPNDNCDCLKPKPGMLLQAAEEYGINLKSSWMVGDRSTDVQTGLNAGTRTILVTTGNEFKADGAEFTAKNLLEAVEYIKSK